MLYDILPPLIFFASFGGIIIIFSRVVVRVRRQRFAAHIQAHARSRQSFRSDRLLRPGVRGVQLMKSRLALIPHAVKATVQRVHAVLQGWREERRAVVPKPTDTQLEHRPTDEGILMPQTTWRDRIVQVAAHSRRGIASMGKSVVDTLSRQPVGSGEDVFHKTVEMESEEGQRTSRPKLRLVHVTAHGAPSKDTKNQRAKRALYKPKEQEKKSKVSVPQRKPLISQVLQRQKEPSPLQQAIVAIRGGKYDEAEDVLVPYIVDHAKDTRAYMLLGKAALAQHAWDEAIEIYEQVLKINNRQKGAYAVLGYAAMKAGRFTLALQMLQRAHGEAPTNKRIIRQLLKIAQRMDNTVLQRNLLEELAELN